MRAVIAMGSDVARPRLTQQKHPLVAHPAWSPYRRMVSQREIWRVSAMRRDRRTETREFEKGEYAHGDETQFRQRHSGAH